MWLLKYYHWKLYAWFKTAASGLKLNFDFKLSNLTTLKFGLFNPPTDSQLLYCNINLGPNGPYLDGASTRQVKVVSVASTDHTNLHKGKNKRHLNENWLVYSVMICLKCYEIFRCKSLACCKNVEKKLSWVVGLDFRSLFAAVSLWILIYTA